MLSNNSRKEKSNKQQTSNWSDRRQAWIEEVASSFECRRMNEKGTHRVLMHVITLVTADWYGSDSSWIISQIKVIETIMFSVKLRGPNKALGDYEFLFFLFR